MRKAHAGKLRISPPVRARVVDLCFVLASALALWAAGARADVLLSELKVNPPNEDSPHEFIEITGTPGVFLTNVFLLAVDGNIGTNQGTVACSINLHGAHAGSNGVLVIVATNHSGTIPAAASVVYEPLFSQAGGILPNNSVSFLLVRSATPILAGDDLDPANTGALNGLPPGAALLDAVGWTDGDAGDRVYGGAELTASGVTPDAATRFPGNGVAFSAAAWFCGDLSGGGSSLVYDEGKVSANFPTGSLLTPGGVNNTAPIVGPMVPICGVIGDPVNPLAGLPVSDRETTAGALVVWATSSKSSVVPRTNLTASFSAQGGWVLNLSPLGVGYATITVWVSDGALTNKATFPYAASEMGRAGGVWHLGASDGSTAIAVDTNYMIVGDDENQTLRLYPRHISSLPLAQFDMSSYLDLPDAKPGYPREVDVEASTRSGNRLYWMGSHGHAADGEPRTNRTRIFATDLLGGGAGATLSYAGRYSFLKNDLINWDSGNLHGKGANYYGLAASDADGVPPKAPDGSGFAIEGLAMLPGSTNAAYVAFRAPIVPATNRTAALLVPVLNFAAVVAGNLPPGSCVFGTPVELDLYGRGIRSIEGGTNGYVIIAGPAGADTGPYPQNFRLYTWNGDPATHADERVCDLAGLNPEGIVEVPPGPWTSNTPVQLLSDNGGTVFYGDGVKAKALTVPNFKKCRTDVVALGRVTRPVPIITSAAVSGTTLTLRWRSLKGESYRVQSTTDPASTVWTDEPGPVVAPGPYAAKDILLNGPRRFYRLSLAN